MRSRDVLKCCNIHYEHYLNNKIHFLTEHTINAIDYFNYNVHLKQIKLFELFFAQLKKFNKANIVFLNFCVGPGFIELFNKNNKNVLKISSVEYESQLKCYEAIRKHYNVDEINYVCNDLNSENFEIKKCKTHFNYVILKDFVSFWKIENLKSALLKFKIYSKRIVLLEKDTNLSEIQKDYLNLKSYEIINIIEDWKLYLIKMKSLDENV